MKQFLMCFLLSFMAYFIGAMFQGHFREPDKWVPDAKIGVTIALIVIWIIPIMINYLTGVPNF